jgi:hypothetical protein
MLERRQLNDLRLLQTAQEVRRAISLRDLAQARASEAQRQTEERDAKDGMDASYEFWAAHLGSGLIDPCQIANFGGDIDRRAENLAAAQIRLRQAKADTHARQQHHATADALLQKCVSKVRLARRRLAREREEAAMEALEALFTYKAVCT